MNGPINVKSPNNTNKWQMGFNSAFKGLREEHRLGIFENRMLRRKFRPKTEEIAGR
jgi:hypothetical protein